ncbi:MAG: type II toxin-antitoxin system HicA family toxin [Acidimicrobiales bacterium]
MASRELRSILKRLGCIESRQSGSHPTVRCGTCVTTIAVHPAGTSPKAPSTRSNGTSNPASARTG